MAELPRRSAHFQPGEAVHVYWNAADEMSLPMNLRCWFLLPARLWMAVLFAAPLAIVWPTAC